MTIERYIRSGLRREAGEETLAEIASQLQRQWRDDFAVDWVEIFEPRKMFEIIFYQE